MKLLQLRSIAPHHVCGGGAKLYGRIVHKPRAQICAPTNVINSPLPQGRERVK